MVRVATIGTNFITDWLLDAAKHCEGFEYVAAYSRNEETARAFADKYGVKTLFTDLEELACSTEIDAVYVASPNSLHCEQSILMMEHGKHVLCEKAAASNAKELRLMIETAQRHNVVYLEAIKNIFEPGFLAIKDNLHKLGPIRRVSFEYCQYSSRYDNFKAGIMSNIFDPRFSAGALMDIGIYCVHPLVKLFGRPEILHAEALLLNDQIDGTGTVLARAGDILMDIIYSKITHSDLPCQIQGEAATLVFARVSNIDWVEIRYKDGRVEKIDFAKDYPTMTYQIIEWLSLIATDTFVHEHNKQSLMVMEVMDEIRQKMGVTFPADH